MPKNYTEYTFEVWQGGMMVAACSSTNYATANAEAAHYAAMYVQGGPIEIREKVEKRQRK